MQGENGGTTPAYVGDCFLRVARRCRRFDHWTGIRTPDSSREFSSQVIEALGESVVVEGDAGNVVLARIWWR
jgi:hypothetical protein